MKNNPTKWRKKRGFSLGDLSRLCGVSKSYLWKIEAGESDPTITVAYAISDVFGVTVYEIFPNE